jgi:hypothetical protein
MRKINCFGDRYYVDENGRVFSLCNGVYSELKERKHRQGYIRYALCESSTVKQFYAHRLVAECYIPKVEGKDFVNHLDGDKTNNHVSNLEWCTKKENSLHARDNGLCDNRGEKSWKTNLTNEIVLKIREMYANGIRGIALQKMFNLSKWNTYCIATGRRWKHLN